MCAVRVWSIILVYAAALTGMSRASFVQRGAPLVLLVVGGTFGLSTFVQGRVDEKDRRYRTASRREFTLDEEHKRAMSKLNIDEYDMVPVPKQAK